MKTFQLQLWAEPLVLKKPKTSKVRKGERSRGQSLATLLTQRQGSREEWNQALFHAIVDRHDQLTEGRRLANGCSCSIEVRGNQMMTVHLCPNHLSIGEAHFDRQAHEISILMRATEFRNWYFQLPVADLRPGVWNELRRVALIPEDFGYRRPSQWLGRTLAVEPRFGSCGCSYQIKSYRIEGVAWQVRSDQVFLMVKTGSCGNYNDSCPRPNLPLGRVASRKINEIIKRYRKV